MHSLAHNISGVEGCVGALGWGLGKLISKSIIHTDLHKPNNKFLSGQLDTFGARTNHEQTQIHKIHHNSDLGEAPLIVYYVFGHGASTQMSFCPRTPKWEYRNSQNWDFRDFGGSQLCVQTSNWGKVWSKVVAFFKSFLTVCSMPPEHRKFRAIPNF